MPFIVLLLIGFLSGGVWGLITYAVCSMKKKPQLAKLALMWCLILGTLTVGSLSFIAAVGFIIAACVMEGDYRPKNATNPVIVQRAPAAAPAGTPVGGNLNLTCLSGPLRGQVYLIGKDGVTIGRDITCNVRIPDGTPGVSRRHCCIRWQQGVPVLIDLGSTHGTFQGDGRRLPPSYPTQLAAGSRFYLGTPDCLFQIALV